jgi:hypothetical protein
VISCDVLLGPDTLARGVIYAPKPTPWSTSAAAGSSATATTSHTSTTSSAPSWPPCGAVEAVIATLVGLPGQHRRLPTAEEIRATASQAEVFQGTGTLMLGLVGVIAEDPAQRLEIIPAVVRRLRREEPTLPADVVATIGGALVAAALGYSPTRWRRANLPWPEDDDLPVSPDEAFGWAMTVRLLVDFIDDALGPGTAAGLFDEFLANDD